MKKNKLKPMLINSVEGSPMLPETLKEQLKLAMTNNHFNQLSLNSYAKTGQHLPNQYDNTQKFSPAPLPSPLKTNLTLKP